MRNWSSGMILAVCMKPTALGCQILIDYTVGLDKVREAPGSNPGLRQLLFVFPYSLFEEMVM